MNDLLVAGAGPAGWPRPSTPPAPDFRSPWWTAAGTHRQGLRGRADAAHTATPRRPRNHPARQTFRGITYLDRNRRVEAQLPRRRRTRVRRTVLSEALHDTAATAGVRIVKGNIGDIEQDANGVRCGGFCSAVPGRCRRPALADPSPTRAGPAHQRPSPLGHPPALPDSPVDRHRRGPLGRAHRGLRHPWWPMTASEWPS